MLEIWFTWSARNRWSVSSTPHWLCWDLFLRCLRDSNVDIENREHRASHVIHLIQCKLRLATSTDWPYAISSFNFNDLEWKSDVVVGKSICVPSVTFFVMLTLIFPFPVAMPTFSTHPCLHTRHVYFKLDVEWGKIQQIFYCGNYNKLLSRAVVDSEPKKSNFPMSKKHRALFSL